MFYKVLLFDSNFLFVGKIVRRVRRSRRQLWKGQIRCLHGWFTDARQGINDFISPFFQQIQICKIFLPVLWDHRSFDLSLNLLLGNALGFGLVFGESAFLADLSRNLDLSFGRLHFMLQFNVLLLDPLQHLQFLMRRLLRHRRVLHIAFLW